MRYVAIQLLTWGTIAGAIGSALVLASWDNAAPRFGVGLPTLAPLPSEPTQAGRARAKPAPPSASVPAASAASVARR